MWKHYPTPHHLEEELGNDLVSQLRDASKKNSFHTVDRGRTTFTGYECGLDNYSIDWPAFCVSITDGNTFDSAYTYWHGDWYIGNGMSGGVTWSLVSTCSWCFLSCSGRNTSSYGPVTLLAFTVSHRDASRGYTLAGDESSLARCS